MELKAGLRCASVACTTEAIVIKAVPATVAVLSCGGHPMVPHQDARGAQEPIVEGFDHGSLLGKRYGLGDEIEVLVTKPGAGSLALDGRLLEEIEPKPLPSSD